MRKKTVDNHKVKFMHMEVWKAAGFPSISPVTLPLSPSLSHAKSRSWRALTQAPITHRYTHTHCSHHIWFFPVSEWHKKKDLNGTQSQRGVCQSRRRSPKTHRLAFVVLFRNSYRGPAPLNPTNDNRQPLSFKTPDHHLALRLVHAHTDEWKFSVTDSTPIRFQLSATSKITGLSDC